MPIVKRKRTSLEGVEKIAILADCGCVKNWEEGFPELLGRVWDVHSPGLFIVIGDIGMRGSFYHYGRILKYMKKYPARWIALPGNHDRPLFMFRLFFGSPRKRVDAGKWRFIGINTSKKVFTEKESKWMAKEIKDNSIILSHMPPSVEGWSFYSMPVESTARFFNIIDKNRSKVKAMFFGHIHGHSEMHYSGIPMTVTGGSAQSRVIRNNRYNEKAKLEMVIFNTGTGEWTVHEGDS